MLTPDTLRLIGKTVAQITSQTGEIMLAYNAATSRLTLQKSELARLIMKCKDMGLLVENLKGPAKLETEKRIADVQEEQKRLLGKYDRLLQALMEKASPELSEYETKWFQELKRMKQEVLGSGKYDEDSLMMRIKAVFVLLFGYTADADFISAAARERVYQVIALTKSSCGKGKTKWNKIPGREPEPRVFTGF